MLAPVAPTCLFKLMAGLLIVLFVIAIGNELVLAVFLFKSITEVRTKIMNTIRKWLRVNMIARVGLLRR